MIRLLHTPEHMILPGLAAYPAHLHIGLLPGFRRRGFGRRLTATLLDALGGRGVPAVHLGMAGTNTWVRAFHDRLGLQVTPVQDPGLLTHLGRATSGLRRGAA